MVKYIGLDAHSSTCTFCVTNEEGFEIDNTTIRTNGRLLINYLRMINGYKRLTFEECELSSWLYEILGKEVDELIVCNPVYNREYKRRKTDKLDARKLAKLLRGGFLSSVFHNGRDREKFRGLMSAYTDLVVDSVRLKNRYKSIFRKEGNRIRGEKIYRDNKVLKEIKGKVYKFIGKELYARINEIERRRKEYEREIKICSRPFKEIKMLKTIPGIGPIRAAQISAQVIYPKRFANKYKYYSYCGLVRHKRISGDKEYGGNKIWGNRVLKNVYKMAAVDALRGCNSLKKHYEYLRRKGVSDKNARNAISRKIAAISLSIWKNNCKYEDKRGRDIIE